MRTFSCIKIQDASSLPWVWEVGSTEKPIWGANIVPQPQYSSFSTDSNGLLEPVGDPTSYTWKALLDPADTPLPYWITETTPPPAPVDKTIP